MVYSRPIRLKTMSEWRTLSSIDGVFLRSNSYVVSVPSRRSESGRPYDEDDFAQVASDLEMALCHLLAVRDDDCASCASCSFPLPPSVDSSMCLDRRINAVPSRLTMYRPSCPVAPKTVTVCPDSP